MPKLERMIPPIDTLLPELEAAVAERVESALLAKMDPEELRSIIYSLVERQRRATEDPKGHFEDLVSSARGRHADLLLAKEQSIAVRSDVLSHLLTVLHPAIPSLLGPITIAEQFSPGKQPRRAHHPILTGYQLVDGVKKSRSGADGTAYSGTSWWIVGILPEHKDLGTGVRYASASHGGIVSHGDGVVATEITLVSSEEAAERIRDTHFRPILERLHKRLASLIGTKVSAATDNLWSVSQRLQSALDAMS